MTCVSFLQFRQTTYLITGPNVTTTGERLLKSMDWGLVLLVVEVT